MFGRTAQRSGLTLVALGLALALHASAGADEPPRSPSSSSGDAIRMAITVDDLPGPAVRQAGYDSVRLLSELAATLRAHRVESATGFVIGERVASDPEARAALAVWTAAGYELGNHSYGHLSLHAGDLGRYVQDLGRAEPLMQELAQRSGRAVRYFRYPFLEEGQSARDRRALSELLSARGYAIARVSLDFFDWAWADPYARCLARADRAGMGLLSRSYLERAAAYLDWAVAGARAVLNRPLPQVLLLHANVATVVNLDALLTQYERAGVRFIPLSEALADPAYRAEYEGDISHVLTLSSAHAGRPLAPAPGRPDDLLALVCR